MNTIRKMWQERSSKFGSRIEGVLPKSWPRKLNDYLDGWMYGLIRKQMPKSGKLNVLDLGCGYGRLAEKVLKDYKESKVFGIDIASNYVKLFNKDLSPRGKAVVGDIKRLPYADNLFDVVYMVTTLMYLTDKKDQKKAISEIMRVLKKGGRFVMIERNPVGHSIINLFGLVQVLRGESKKEIHSVSFGKEYLSSLIKDGGGRIKHLDGIPFFTLFFYPLFILSKLGLKDLPLSFVKKIDDKAGRVLLTLSLYISYSGQKI